MGFRKQVVREKAAFHERLEFTKLLTIRGSTPEIGRPTFRNTWCNQYQLIPPY